MLSLRQSIFTLGSLCVTSAVVGNVYVQKKQFYPSVVFLTKSNPCMAVIYVQAAIIVWLVTKAMGNLFFGQLRLAEVEHLFERSWYAITETFLAFTVFRDDFSSKFIALCVLLLVLKGFHWVAEDRVDFMERSPNISLLFHVRILSLLAVLGLLDYAFVNHAYYSVTTMGASVQVVFGFEYAILLSSVVYIFVKCLLHSIDSRAETQWENKAVLLLYTELMMSISKVFLYATFMVVIFRIYMFPLFAIRPMYLSLIAFKRALKDVILSRQAINNMNTLYPDATAEELASADNVCIICREEMQAAPAGAAVAAVGSGGNKKLPCNHIFHAACLRSWFQRQQTCPTCRSDVLSVGNRAGAAGGNNNNNNNNNNNMNVNNAGGVNGRFAAFAAVIANNPFHNPQPQQGQQGQQIHFPFNLQALFPLWPNQNAIAVAPNVPPAAGNNNRLDNNNVNQRAPATSTGGSSAGEGQPGQQQQQPQQAMSGSSQSQQTAFPGGAATSGTAGAPGATGSPNPTAGIGGVPPASACGPSIVIPPPTPPYFGLFGGVPPPPPPTVPAGLNLATLTEDELRAMEGAERGAIEVRIRHLRHIQILLDAAFTMMNQYNSTVANPSMSASYNIPPAATVVAAGSTASSASEVNMSNLVQVVAAGAVKPDGAQATGSSQSMCSNVGNSTNKPSTSASADSVSSATSTVGNSGGAGVARTSTAAVSSSITPTQSSQTLSPVVSSLAAAKSEAESESQNRSSVTLPNATTGLKQTDPSSSGKGCDGSDSK